MSKTKMKFDYENLRKRIEVCKEIRPPNPMALIEEWFEGSKKELRERFDYYDNLMLAIETGDYTDTPSHVLDKLKNEILGE